MTGVHPADPLEVLLARYAESRLAPSTAQMTGLRSRLVQAYVIRAVREPRPAPRRIYPRWRWAFILATVLALTAGSSLAAAQSGPGQPFYHLRLSLESLTLPAQGSARVHALLDRLDARLAEASAASQRGDHGAAADAVAAYEDTLAALRASVESSGSDAFVIDRLAQHAVVLENLLDRLPPPAQQGLQHALDQTQRARDAISRRPASQPGNGPPTWAPGASQHTSGPEQTSSPEPTGGP